jgi:hypothetical protein
MSERTASDTETLRPDPSAHVHQLHERRHRKEGDVKVIITQRDSDTGGGKTTLAVWLALCWDQHGWHGQKKGTTDPAAFLNTMPDLPPHSCMILDEAEELDARRSMQEENIQFSKKWMKLRTRQIDSILTLPTATALDKRLLELAHVRLHVTNRGECKVYEVSVDDRSWEVEEKFIEHYYWPDVSETDVFQNLDQEKQDDIDQGAGQTDTEAKQSSADLKRAIRQEAKRRRRSGESIRSIVENIPNNPDTGAAYSTETVHRWTEGVDDDA